MMGDGMAGRQDAGQGQGQGHGGGGDADWAGAAAPAVGRALAGITVNLLVRDVADQAAFLAGVLGLAVLRQSADHAIMQHGGSVLQLHSDASYHAHPLPALLPEAGPRGPGVEIRLHEADPDAAAARAALHPGALLLQPPADKPHGLREAFILCPMGYVWVPSRRI
jgi:hypothetical protein